MAAVLALASCGGSEGTSSTPASAESSPEVDVANPAAVFCEEQGGRAFGPEPMCGLPDGSTVDAWDFYRAETSGGSASPTTIPPTTERPTTVPSTTTPPTTIPPTAAPPPTVAPTTIPPVEPGTSLDALAGLLGAVDYSRVSEGPCGTFALVVESDRITFYEWDGDNWNDQSERLGPDGSSEPIRVTSRDYTGDGVTEFLVEYEALKSSGSYRFGSIFYPTYGEGLYGDGSWGCDWGWSSFRGDYEDFNSPPYPQTLEYLRWEDGKLRATEFPYRGITAEAVVTFDPSSDVFEVQWP